MSPGRSGPCSFMPSVSSKNLNLIREVPVNAGAEQALLGAILSNNLAYEKVEEFLEPEYFSSKINRIIFKSIKFIEFISLIYFELTKLAEIQ